MLNTLLNHSSDSTSSLARSRSRAPVPTTCSLVLWLDIARSDLDRSATSSSVFRRIREAARSTSTTIPRMTLKALRFGQADFTRKSSWQISTQWYSAYRRSGIWLGGLGQRFRPRDVSVRRGESPAITLYGQHGSLRRLRAAAARSPGPAGDEQPRSADERVLTSSDLSNHCARGRALDLDSESRAHAPWPTSCTACNARTSLARVTGCYTRTLLTYLPNVDTISQAVHFYFIFTFSTPTTR